MDLLANVKTMMEECRTLRNKMAESRSKNEDFPHELYVELHTKEDILEEIKDTLVVFHGQSVRD